VITRCINAACDEVTLSTALGTLVDACEKLALDLEFGVEHDPICSVDFHSADDEFLFTGTDPAEMTVLLCAFYFCCYIRCEDEDEKLVTQEGSWRRLVARFALMSFQGIGLEAAKEQTAKLDEQETLELFESLVKEKV